MACENLNLNFKISKKIVQSSEKRLGITAKPGEVCPVDSISEFNWKLNSLVYQTMSQGAKKVSFTACHSGKL